MYSDQENSSDVQENHESPMDKIIETVFDHFQQAYNTKVSEKMEQEHLSEDDAKEQVFEDMRPIFRKGLVNEFTDTLMWINALRQDPVYRAIQKQVIELWRWKILTKEKH